MSKGDCGGQRVALQELVTPSPSRRGPERGAEATQRTALLERPQHDHSDVGLDLTSLTHPATSIQHPAATSQIAELESLLTQLRARSGQPPRRQTPSAFFDLFTDLIEAEGVSQGLGLQRSEGLGDVLGRAVEDRGDIGGQLQVPDAPEACGLERDEGLREIVHVLLDLDGQAVDLAGRALLCVDTPGHARHHLCVWDERSRGWFTGDTFGLSYREFDSPRGPFVLPTSSPVQFEPEALKRWPKTPAYEPSWAG